MNNSDKAIKFYHPDMPLPPDLSKSNKALDDYLSTLKQASEAEQRRQYRYSRMVRTRQQNAMKENKIKEVAIEQRSVTICNNTLEDSAIIVEKRVGYKLTCPRCNWIWIWHGKKDRYFVSCSRCHKSFKLNWK